MKIDSNKETTRPPYYQVIDDNHCITLPKPPAQETCHGLCESTRWEYSDWAPCSATCNRGTQTRQATCMDTNSNRPIDDHHCAKSEKVTQQICNRQKCPVWTSTEWTPCSTTCGRGVRTKSYYCNLDGKIVDSSSCDPRQTNEEMEECNNNDRPCVGWVTGFWSECSASCGEGQQSRSVNCKDLATSQAIPDDFCRDILKPNTTKKCSEDCQNFEDNSIDRGGFKWITGAWSQCSQTCDGGISSRMVVCRSSGGGETNDRFCSPTSRPIATIECNTAPCPTWKWGGWSGCDSNCEKHRLVSCRNSTGDHVIDSQCDPQTRPSTTNKCKLAQCPRSTFPTRDYFNPKQTKSRYKWKVGRWKACNTDCGRGARYRQIQCEDTLNGVILVDQFCKNLTKPKTQRPCEKYLCDYTWIEGYWSTCSATCGVGYKTRNVTCHKVYKGEVVDRTPLADFNFQTRPKEYCDMYRRPSSTANCTVSYCQDGYVWKAEPWQQVSLVFVRFCFEKSFFFSVFGELW